MLSSLQLSMSQRAPATYVLLSDHSRLQRKCLKVPPCIACLCDCTADNFAHRPSCTLHNSLWNSNYRTCASGQNAVGGGVLVLHARAYCAQALQGFEEQLNLLAVLQAHVVDGCHSVANAALVNNVRHARLLFPFHLTSDQTAAAALQGALSVFTERSTELSQHDIIFWNTLGTGNPAADRRWVPDLSKCLVTAAQQSITPQRLNAKHACVS